MMRLFAYSTAFSLLLPIAACGGADPSGPDDVGVRDVDLDGNLCSPTYTGVPTTAPLESSWPYSPYTPLYQDASQYGRCDVETTGLVVTGGVRGYERTAGCGLQTFRFGGGIYLREASYDEAGVLVGWHSVDDALVHVSGVPCLDWAFVAGAWPPPACAQQTEWQCLGGGCPRFLEPGIWSVTDLVLAFGAHATLSAMDAASTCNVDPTSIVGTPTWREDYVAIRTEGCGVVTFDLPYGPWSRSIVYDVATDAAVGASSSDDIPAAFESSACGDYAVTAGAYPAPACASSVVRYCTVTPHLRFE